MSVSYFPLLCIEFNEINLSYIKILLLFPKVRQSNVKKRVPSHRDVRDKESQTNKNNSECSTISFLFLYRYLTFTSSIHTNYYQKRMISDYSLFMFAGVQWCQPISADTFFVSVVIMNRLMVKRALVGRDFAK